MNALGERYGGSWTPGENPPDAYFETRHARIAVEVSTIVQHVPGKDGGSVPRLSYDRSVVEMVDRLEQVLRPRVKRGRYAILTLHSPLDNIRKVEAALAVRVADALDTLRTDQTISIAGNTIRITAHKGARPSGKCVVGLVPNRFSSPDIARNARSSLEDRIRVKAAKMKGIAAQGPCWLALLNDYYLADMETYRRVFAAMDIEHPFQRIVIVSDGGVAKDLLDPQDA